MRRGTINPYREVRSHALSGGIRKAQTREIRQLAAEWDAANTRSLPDVPTGAAIRCRCGHAAIIGGDFEALKEKRFRCTACGRVTPDAEDAALRGLASAIGGEDGEKLWDDAVRATVRNRQE